MLHDSRDDCTSSIADAIDIDFDRHLPGIGQSKRADPVQTINAFDHKLLELCLVVTDFHSTTTEHKTGSPRERESQLRLRHFEPDSLCGQCRLQVVFNSRLKSNC